MKILVIGGTQFVGRHYAEAALRAGHEVTLFHRGSKGTGSIPGAFDILGDRTKNLDRVSDTQWDLVMDSSAYLPGVTRQSVQALKDVCHRYLFVSTVSVYDQSTPPPIREQSPYVPIGDPDTTQVTGETYGYLKVLCEREVVEGFGDQALIIRPGIVAGSFDPTNRFTYWVMRFKKGGKVLVPEIPQSRMQLIDARDLGEFMVRAGDAGLSGPYNAAGPHSTFGTIIEACHRLNPSAEIVWASPQSLETAEIKFGADLPLAVTPGEDNLFGTSSEAAIAKGLTYRSLEDTAQDVVIRQASLPAEAPGTALVRRAGLSPEAESAFIASL